MLVRGLDAGGEASFSWTALTLYSPSFATFAWAVQRFESSVSVLPPPVTFHSHVTPEGQTLPVPSVRKRLTVQSSGLTYFAGGRPCGPGQLELSGSSRCGIVQSTLSVSPTFSCAVAESWTPPELLESALALAVSVAVPDFAPLSVKLNVRDAPAERSKPE